MKYAVLLLLLIKVIFCFGQPKYTLYVTGGLSNLFEAEVANESSGTFLGIGLDRKIGKFTVFASYEKISCQNNARNDISQFRIEGGEWMIAWYKGYINLERRDWVFDDVMVDEKLFTAGKWNFPGNEQTFDSSNIILGVSYEMYRKKIFSVSARLGLATSLIHVSAVNLTYTSQLNDVGKQFNVEIPTYLKYLYFSSYLAIPFEFEITEKLSVGIVGSLYRATNL
ncbi:MAG: hypothetical protein IPN86_19040, partial [Saprospiraceae bacterium]|nr:hypothetical protein [Saprospiraceae bacterium]